MEQKWKVKLYQSTNGKFPVQEFIDNLEISGQAKVRNTIHLFHEFGITLGLPHAKKLTGTELWELRILGSSSLRILYVAIVEKTFLLLHGFKKKSQKTPAKEIKIAESRLVEYKARQK